MGIEPALRTVRIDLAPTPADVAARADMLSVHVALAPETKGLVNAALLAKLKPGAIFVNTARGEVVDYQALAAAVREQGPPRRSRCVRQRAAVDRWRLS